MKNVVVIDDDLELANLYAEKINSLSNFRCVKTFESTEDFLSSSFIPSIIILDLVMPKLNGIESIKIIHDKYPNTKIVINSIKEDLNIIISVLKEGAVGYLDKFNFNIHIENVLLTVDNDEAYISPKITKRLLSYFNESKIIMDSFTNREKDIADGILQGLSYKLVADKYSISIDTVRMHIKNIYKKLHINSKGELISKLNAMNSEFPEIK